MASVILHPTGTETSSGTGSLVEVDSNTIVGMFVNISAVAGVLPTLIVQLQESPNGTDWYNISSMVNASNLISVSLNSILPSGTQYIANQARIVWTIAGVGASFTFEVELETLP